MAKLLLTPDADGYQSTDGTEIISTSLDGGPARYRADKIGASKIVSVKWTMNPNQYAYWRAFYVTATQKGALSFSCDLLSEDGTEPKEHTCNFVPGSIVMPSQRGLTYVQTATLEVVPIAHDPTLDAILLLFGPSGSPVGFFGALEHLVLVKMPDTLHV